MDFNKELKIEADKILINYGLKLLLEKYGCVVISGSYSLDMMVWRDLDIFVDIRNIKQDDIYEISFFIFKIFKPIWFETKCTLNDISGCPKGYFLGFETEILNSLWNIDIWFTTSSHILENIKYIDNIKKKINSNNKRIIMDIKKEIYNHTFYGDKLFSIDIYDAVLNYEVKTINDFKKWLKDKKDIEF